MATKPPPVPPITPADILRAASSARRLLAVLVAKGGAR